MKKSLISKFLLMVGIIVGSFVVLLGAAVFAYTMAGGTLSIESIGDDIENIYNNNIIGTATPPTEKPSPTPTAPKVPLRTNFMVVGLDQEEYNTDTLFVGCFDSQTGKVSLISIPRDTKVTFNHDWAKEEVAAGKKMPSVSKINALRALAKKDGLKYLKAELEAILNIKMDYYVEINIQAFRKIVDAVDGVEFEVPKGGLYYKDPLQKLVIAIPGGKQVLDGKQAEGLVRFRGTYARGDLQRIEVQQAFMKAMFQQVLNKDTLMKNALELVSIMISYVKTDFGITDVPKYMGFINKLSVDSIETYTLPGHAKTETLANGDDASYYYLDTAEVKALSDKVFYGIGVEPETEEDEENASSETDNTSPKPSSSASTTASPKPSASVGTSASPKPSSSTGTSASPKPSSSAGSSASSKPNSSAGSSTSPKPNSSASTSASPKPSSSAGSSTSPKPSSSAAASTKPSATVTDVKSLRIQVLNGSGGDGAATKFSNVLKADGFKVDEVGNYSGTQKKENRIVARDEAHAEAFTDYFENYSIELDNNMPSKFDVIIILGTSGRK